MKPMGLQQYTDEASKTVPTGFHTDVVRPVQVLRQLLDFEYMAKHVEVFRKAVFYKSPITMVPPQEVLNSDKHDGKQMHALMGLITGVGALSEKLRAYWTGDLVDRKVLMSVMGNILWHWANEARALGLDPVEIMQASIKIQEEALP